MQQDFQIALFITFTSHSVEPTRDANSQHTLRIIYMQKEKTEPNFLGKKFEGKKQKTEWRLYCELNGVFPLSVLLHYL